MALLEDLTEEEAYLYAILSDESGLDAAEFTWKDEGNDDGCWRAWSFQWMWYRSKEKLQIDRCARSLGKSVSIQLRGFIFPFVHPGQEMLITAPELVHLKPVTQAIEHRVLSIRLSRECLDTRNRSTGFTHQPFAAQFINGARILGRIPQRDGKGVKGMHPLWLELDEGQDYPPAGWTELFETLKFGTENATWRAHGVTRGVRDTFYNLTQDDSGWKIHAYTAHYRPDWSDEERQQKIKMYGGRNSHDYKRNILGWHGDQTNPLFVLARLMACVRLEDNDQTNLNYISERITAEKMEQYGIPIEEFVKVPARHSTYENVWIGADIGMTNHPTEVLCFAEMPVQTRGKSFTGTEIALQLVSRWHLERISAGDQRRLFAMLQRIYKPKAIALDKTGVGLPIYQDMMDMSPELAAVTKGYNFSSKIAVGFDDPTDIDNTLIMRNVLEYASDKLREYVDSGWLVFPNDEELIREWQGQGVTVVRSSMNPYGKKEYSKGTFHTLDAGRMAILGKVQDAIEKMLNDPIDGFHGALDIFYDGGPTGY
jgi:hypothetical protein